MVLVVGLGLQVLNRVRSIEKMVGAARESVAWFKWWCLHLVVCDGEQPVAWWFYLFKKRHLWWLGSRLVGSTRAGVATSKRENKENEKRRERNRGWRAWLLPLQSDATGVCCVEMLWDVEGGPMWCAEGRMLGGVPLGLAAFWAGGKVPVRERGRKFSLVLWTVAGRATNLLWG